jgi:hypothetical protein
VQCPDCKGAGKSMAFWDGRSQGTSGVGFLACLTCGGAGTIGEDHATRIQAGAAIREDRKKRGLTLRDEAKRLGITAKELSDRESGRLQTLEDACRGLLEAVYVGEGQVVCPKGLLPHIRAIYEVMKAKKLERG